jgi:hypothetical protein
MAVYKKYTHRMSATAMVCRNVSEAFWKTGDRVRAVAVFKEGHAAGGDSWLYMSSAARAATQQPTGSPKPAAPPTARRRALLDRSGR